MKAYPHKSTVVKENVTIRYPDGTTASGDVIRTQVGATVLWTGRAVRPLPENWEEKQVEP